MGFYATTEVRDENRCSPVFRSDKSENRLVKTESLASVPDAAKVKVENLYDYRGRRVRKTVSSDYSGGTYTTTNVTTYVWDGFNIIAEMCDAGYTNYYVHGLDQSGKLQGAGGVGGALSMTRLDSSGTNTYLYCFDGNGNVVNLVDASDGSIAATYEYSPFGSLIRSTGDMADDNPVRWSTKHTDDETGLVMYQLRAYSPALGRFISRDPIHEQGGLNLYGFVQNNPVLYIDQYGLVHWGTFAHGVLQIASGTMMWVVVGTSEIGTGGMATPIAIGLGVWGSANIASGINTLTAAFNDKGPPDPVQVQIVEQTYEAISGEPMGPTGQQITRSAVYAVDIVCACYTINISWKTMMEKGTIWQMYPEIPMETPAGVEVIKVGSQLQFYGHVTGSGMQTFSVGLDYYGLWNSTYDLSSGAWELYFEQGESQFQNGGGN